MVNRRCATTTTRMATTAPSTTTPGTRTTRWWPSRSRRTRCSTFHSEDSETVHSLHPVRLKCWSEVFLCSCPGCTVYSTNMNGRECGNNVATFASTASLADCAAAVDAASECGQHFERNRGSGRCSCLGPTTTCSESADGNVDRHIITKSCGQSLFMTYASTSLTNRRDPQDPAAAPSRRVFCGPACPLALSARLFACPSVRSPTLRVVSRLNITIR